MNREEAINVPDDDAWATRLAPLESAVKSAVDALGGFEDGRYRPGDECLGCLKDLKRLWRIDDRAVAAFLWSTRALPNDLVPLLLETASRGLFEDKRAIACVDLMTAMTWPVDIAEELKELAEAEEDEVEKEDYTRLLQSHLHYKAALLRPGVMEALIGTALPCLAKEPKERTERDAQIVGVVLYLVRNLAFIKDLPTNAHASADQAEFATLQTKFVRILSGTHMLDLVLTMASNADADPLFERWNTLVLEIFYLLFRGVKPESLATDQSKVRSHAENPNVIVTILTRPQHKLFIVSLPLRINASEKLHATHLPVTRASALLSLLHSIPSLLTHVPRHHRLTELRTQSERSWCPQRTARAHHLMHSYYTDSRRSGGKRGACLTWYAPKDLCHFAA